MIVKNVSKLKPYISNLLICIVIITCTIFNLPSYSVEDSAHAQKTYELPEIVVVGYTDDIEYANNLRIIDSSSIFMSSTSHDNLEQLTFADSAIRFTGSERANGQEINLRGFTDKNVITAIDGIKTRFYSQHDGAVFIDPALVSNIAIYKGANSHIYGSGGIGGYISYNTIGFDEILGGGKKYGLLAKAGYETADSDRNLLLGYATSFGDDNKIMIVGLKRKSSDIKLSDGNNLLADDDIHSVLLKSKLNLAESHQLLMTYHFYRNDAVEPNNPQISDVEAELSRDRATRMLAQTTDKRVQNHGFSFTHKYFGQNTLFGSFDTKTTLYLQDVIVKKTELTSNGVDPMGTLKEREIKSYGIDSIVDLGDWFFGFEVNRDIQDGSRDNAMSALTPAGHTTLFGVFLGKNFLFLEDKAYNLSITPTVRYDHFDLNSNLKKRSDDHLSYSLKASLDGADRSFYGSISKSFRAPNITEIFADGQHFVIPPNFVNNFVMNPDLKPETGLSYEVGFTHHADGMIFGADGNAAGRNVEADNNIFKVSFYYTDYKNFIYQDVIDKTLFTPVCPFPSPANPMCSAGITQFFNINDATVKGFEIEDTYSYKNFRYIASLAKSLGSNKDDGTSLRYQIPLTFSNELQFDYLDWTFGLQARFADSIKAQNLGGYGVFNVAAVYKIDENLLLSLKVDNIFDKTYAKTFSNVFARARTLKVQLSYKW